MRKFFSFSSFFTLFLAILFSLLFAIPATVDATVYGGDSGCVIVGDLAVADNPATATINSNYAAKMLESNSRGQENITGHSSDTESFTEVIRHDLIVRIGTAPINTNNGQVFPFKQFKNLTIM